jgi:hypothetical protein
MHETRRQQPIPETTRACGVKGHPRRAEIRVAKHGRCSCGHALSVRLLVDVGEDLGADEGAAAPRAGARCRCSRYTLPIGQFRPSEVDEELAWRAA